MLATLGFRYLCNSPLRKFRLIVAHLCIYLPENIKSGDRLWF